MHPGEIEPPISIVVPSYNQGRFIRATIDSILNQQDVGDVEVLVMDGGSSDETVDVLRTYGERIQWVSERDRGQSHAINKGFQRARSQILGYLNSDDTYEPGALAAVLEAFREQPGADFVYGDFSYVDAAGHLLASCRTINFDYGILRYDHNFICQPASFWRRSVVDRLGPVAENLYYLMDYEYYLRGAAAGMSFYHLRRNLANLRLHKDCKTMSGSLEATHKYQAVRSSILAPYTFHVRPAAIDRALHRALRAALRLKVLWRCWIENGDLQFRRTRKVMKQVRLG